MNTHETKAQENRSLSLPDDGLTQINEESSLQFQNNRPEVSIQMKLQEAANNSSNSKQITQFKSWIDQHVNQRTLQKKESKKRLPGNLSSGTEHFSNMDISEIKKHSALTEPTQFHRPKPRLSPEILNIVNNTVIQPVWDLIPGSYYKWDSPVDGLQWYSHKETNKLYYVIVNESEIPESQLAYYKKKEGVLWPLNNWLKDAEHWQDGNWKASDLEVVGEETEEKTEPTNFHRAAPAAKWKAIGSTHSKGGKIEKLVQELYLTGERKKIDVHRVIDKLRKLRTLGPKWEELVADPSLMLKPGVFEKFIKFIGSEDEKESSSEEKESSSEDPWAARKRFARSLGASKVYRAIWVNPSVINSIKLQAKKQRIIMPGRCAQESKSCDCSEVLNNFELTMSEHVTGEDASAGLYQSVSSNPKIAEAVANRTRMSAYAKAQRVFGGIEEWGQKKVYLITLLIPNIDLFYIGDITHDFDNFVIELNRNDVHLPIGYSKNAEQLVLGNIKGAQIKDIKEIEKPQGKAVTSSS